MNKNYFSPLVPVLALVLLAGAFASNAYAAAPTAGLVGYWAFDEGSGTIAADSSGSGNAGTLTNGPVWTVGKISNAVNLDGADDFLNFGNPSVLSNMGPLTFAAWVNPVSPPTTGAIIDKGYNTGQYSDSGYDFSIGNYSDYGQISFAYGHSSQNVYRISTGAEQILRGRKVKVRQRVLSETEKKQRRKAIAETILQAMRRMKPKD